MKTKTKAAPRPFEESAENRKSLSKLVHERKKNIDHARVKLGMPGEKAARKTLVNIGKKLHPESVVELTAEESNTVRHALGLGRPESGVSKIQSRKSKKKRHQNQIVSPPTLGRNLGLQAKFLDELVAKLSRLPFGRIGDVVAAIEGRTPSFTSTTPQAPSLVGETVADISDAVMSLDVSGSKLVAVERSVVQAALRKTNGNKAAAARLLGMDRKALERRLRRYR